MKQLRVPALALLTTFVLSHGVFAAEPAPAARVACIGDSITFGAAIKERAQNRCPDKIHPNAAGATIIAQTVATAIAPRKE